MKHLSSFLKSVTLFLASILILFSLISYNPVDISFLTAPKAAAITNLIGIGGAYLAFLLFFLIGYTAYFIPVYLFLTGFNTLGIVRSTGLASRKTISLFAFIFFVSFLAAFIGVFPQSQVDIFSASGIIGFSLASFFKKYLGTHGALLTLFLLIAVNATLLFGFFFVDLVKAIKALIISLVSFIRDRKANQGEGPELVRKKKKLITPAKIFEKIKPEIKVYAPKVETDSNLTSQRASKEELKLKSASLRASVGNKDSANSGFDPQNEQPGKPFDPRNYKLPHPSLIKLPPYSDQRQSKDDIKSKIKELEKTLLDFGVEAKVVSVQKGPVVTMYEVSPQSGTKIQKISVLADDIALSMKSSHVRIVAPIPGKGTVGVEIPNSVKNFVFLREVIEEKAFTNATSKLSVAIGKDVSGNPVVADLTEMPHLLIAGATGAGKTICVNSLISSILFKARPDEVKFIMVDPKMVELAIFSGIPHLIHPIISEAKKAFLALNWATEEMERRYQLLADEGCRNIQAYNKKGKKLPYIVIIVDELADLMIVARDSIETTIQRLAQLSRAVGIHLVLATQRPSVDVITGVIKANFPSRISFKVASKVDSRTVLDSMGADKLLGNGDLLFLKPGALKLIRAQGSFLDDEDIEILANFVKVQGRPVYEEAISEAEKKAKTNLGSDELFDDAVKVILGARQASASILQRRMRVGYTRAARLLDIMEQEGIVGPFCGSKAREIIVEPEKYLAERGWL
ncbi:MAG: DNA translocase FtsK [Candidatus Omnitrophica bacterium]|nr:DNA translocase FtsK [Candidatus Omnitrophota bacterium]